MEIPNDPQFDEHWRRRPIRIPHESVMKYIAEARQQLSLSRDVKLEPGTGLGYIEIKRIKGEFFSFEWYASEIVVFNEEAKEVLEQSGLTGWGCYPLYVRTKGMNTIAEDIFEFVIIGKGGDAITSPPTKLISKCSYCGYSKYERVQSWETFQLDENQWDGSDFFRYNPPYHGMIFMTEKARTYLRGTPLNNWYSFEKPYDPSFYFEEV